jgi:mannose-6-phosphate isomerase-like protein (cupin superfamily)
MMGRRNRPASLSPGGRIRQSQGDKETKAMLEKVNLSEKLAQFDAYWAPRTIGQFNDYDLMVVKVKGEFVWHKHDNTDDLFYVLSGQLTIRMRDRDVELDAGELFVVPKGVEHQTYAEDEAHLLLVELSGTPNTGDPSTAAPRREI